MRSWNVLLKQAPAAGYAERLGARFSVASVTLSLLRVGRRSSGAGGRIWAAMANWVIFLLHGGSDLGGDHLSGRTSDASRRQVVLLHRPPRPLVAGVLVMTSFSSAFERERHLTGRRLLGSLDDLVEIPMVSLLNAKITVETAGRQR